MCGSSGNENWYCNENLTCGANGQCKSGDSREMCKSKDAKLFCPGSAPTPRNNCSLTDGGRGNIICDSSDCKGCTDKYKGCRVFDSGKRSICGNIVKSNPGPGQNTLQQACRSNDSPWSLDCKSKNLKDRDKACNDVCGPATGNKYKCINGKCTISNFENVNM